MIIHMMFPNVKEGYLVYLRIPRAEIRAATATNTSLEMQLSGDALKFKIPLDPSRDVSSDTFPTKYTDERLKLLKEYGKQLWQDLTDPSVDADVTWEWDTMHHMWERTEGRPSYE